VCKEKKRKKKQFRPSVHDHDHCGGVENRKDGRRRRTKTKGGGKKAKDFVQRCLSLSAGEGRNSE
jgi:hypothetical protein